MAEDSLSPVQNPIPANAVEAAAHGFGRSARRGARRARIDTAHRRRPGALNLGRAAEAALSGAG